MEALAILIVAAIIGLVILARREKPPEPPEPPLPPPEPDFFDYPCPYCFRAFRTRAELDEHIRTVHERMPSAEMVYLNDSDPIDLHWVYRDSSIILISAGFTVTNDSDTSVTAYISTLVDGKPPPSGFVNIIIVPAHNFAYRRTSHRVILATNQRPEDLHITCSLTVNSKTTIYPRVSPGYKTLTPEPRW